MKNFDYYIIVKNNKVVDILNARNHPYNFVLINPQPCIQVWKVKIKGYLNNPSV
jgi:hypothetical protein